jgi:hypothetical protein
VVLLLSRLPGVGRLPPRHLAFAHDRSRSPRGCCSVNSIGAPVGWLLTWNKIRSSHGAVPASDAEAERGNTSCCLGKIDGRRRGSSIVGGGMWTEAARVYESNIAKASAVAASLRWIGERLSDRRCRCRVRSDLAFRGSSDELCGGQGACLGLEPNLKTRAHRRLAVPLPFVAVGSRPGVPVLRRDDAPQRGRRAQLTARRSTGGPLHLRIMTLRGGAAVDTGTSKWASHLSLKHVLGPPSLLREMARGQGNPQS